MRPYLGAQDRRAAQSVIARAAPTLRLVGGARHTGGYKSISINETVLYRFDYADVLNVWLRSVRTVLGTVAGKARIGEPKIAAGRAEMVRHVAMDSEPKAVILAPSRCTSG